jgi:outer membrane translocation and assembly module TamA
MGGDVIMRGYPDRRYVDRNSLAAQIEYRSPPLWRISGVVFVNAGKVFDELAHVADGSLHTGWGLGLRFIADREQHVPLRLDVGIDENGGAGVYFLITEAF